jgi:multidrug efflux pump subunit AcrA (membrane-fusion protein)
MTRFLTTRNHFQIAIYSFLCIFGFTFFPGCSGNNEQKSGRGGQTAVPAVEAVQAQYGSLPLTERLNGLVKAKNQVELYPQISATVAEVYVNNGDRVTAGKALVQLRDTEFREQLKQAEADYEIAVAQARMAEAELVRVNEELRRTISLFEKELISPTEMENMQTQAIAADAGAELARAGKPGPGHR